MLPNLIPSIIPIVGGIIDKILPDPEAAAKAKLELVKMQQDGLFRQLEINKAEAANQSLFVSGWRPFVGWLCGVALFMKTMLFPLLCMLSAFYGHTLALPTIDSSELLTLLFALLGIGGLRTIEKVRGVHK